MRLYVLRHGETDYNVQGKFQGQIDIALNENGKRQLEEVVKEFKNIKIDVIFSSPLSRALEMAKKIGESKKMQVMIEPRIIERSFGDLEGKYGIDNFEQKVESYHIEKIEELKIRVFSFLEDITKQYPKDNILIVTHEGIAKMIEAFYYGEEAGREFRLKNGKYKVY